MTGFSIVTRIAAHCGLHAGPFWVPSGRLPLNLPLETLPDFVQASPLALRYRELLYPLAWDSFPERDLRPNWAFHPVPYAPFAAACLVKLDQGLASMGDLHQFLVEQPALLWLLGFPLFYTRRSLWGFDPAASLPTPRHFTRMLRTLPNDVLQFLLDSSIQRLAALLAEQDVTWGDTVSMDTKHILAFVKENNPKAYVSERFNKEKQPAGDPDCKLGCKRRHNQHTAPKAAPPTPTANPVPGDTVQVGEFYWGYGSGITAVKIPHWGEFILAELTQPFDQSDVSYFFPLMTTVERRLGHKPPFAAMDAAYDAWYIYEYFHQAGGFAAVPFVEKGEKKVDQRQFDPSGLPLCAAEQPMPLKFSYWDRTKTLIEHERGKYVCPLLYPQPTGEACPKNHDNWSKGGCTIDFPTGIGARLRYTLDRHSEAFKQVYRQRTATERIFSQALDLGIERPHLRNGQAIANLNTLIYTLINLRLIQRIRSHPQLVEQTHL